MLGNYSSGRYHQKVTSLRYEHRSLSDREAIWARSVIRVAGRINKAINEKNWVSFAKRRSRVAIFHSPHPDTSY